MTKLLLFNKPFGVLSQFSDADGHPGLAHYVKYPGVYPAGRLDHDSEGLLLLTDNGQLQARIADPRHKMVKTYWAQLEGEVTDEAISQLAQGVVLKDGPTRRAQVKRISNPDVWTRSPPIRERKNQPTSWIELQISEGRNRQVRRMTAAVGFPTLRLIRVAIGPWSLETLQPGEWREVTVNMPSSNAISGKAPQRTKSARRKPRA
ncbi:MAG: pseudouridine synthase [Porticoccaceae bacterium]